MDRKQLIIAAIAVATIGLILYFTLSSGSSTAPALGSGSTVPGSAPPPAPSNTPLPVVIPLPPAAPPPAPTNAPLPPPKPIVLPPLPPSDPVAIPGTDVTFPAPGAAPVKYDVAPPPPRYTQILCDSPGFQCPPRMMCSNIHTAPTAPRVCADLNAPYFMALVKEDAWVYYTELLNWMNRFSVVYYGNLLKLRDAGAKIGLTLPSLTPAYESLTAAFNATVKYITVVLADPSSMNDPFDSGLFVGSKALTVDSPDSAFIAVSSYADPLISRLPEMTQTFDYVSQDIETYLQKISGAYDIKGTFSTEFAQHLDMVRMNVQEVRYGAQQLHKLATITEHTLRRMLIWYTESRFTE